MSTPRISASSYSNTAPLIWSFLYGSQHGRVEIILDNAPARSAELLSQDRVDAALVPVIAFQQLPDVRLIADVCVGANERARSVALITSGKDLRDVRSVALDASSRTSVVLTKIIFREFLSFEPEWREAEPDLDAMLNESDCALLIGDPALSIADCGLRIADSTRNSPPYEAGVVLSSDAKQDKENNPPAKAGTLLRKEGSLVSTSAFRIPHSAFRKFDVAELWNRYTGFGFVFAMWMTKLDAININFAGARDEGLQHLTEIASNYEAEIGLSREDMLKYLSEHISYHVDDSKQKGMELYFRLAGKCGLIERVRPISYLE